MKNMGQSVNMQFLWKIEKKATGKKYDIGRIWRGWGASPMGSAQSVQEAQEGARLEEVGAGWLRLGHGASGPGGWPRALVNGSEASGLLLLDEEEAEAMVCTWRQGRRGDDRIQGGEARREAGAVGSGRGRRSPARRQIQAAMREFLGLSMAASLLQREMCEREETAEEERERARGGGSRR